MKIRVEVVYALPARQTVIELELEQGTTLAEALDSLPVRQALGDVVARHPRTGIWGKAAPGNTPLRDRDRVEIYRELAADPKQARRARAIKARAGTRGP
ncbi:MAG TPA: RnfH family protein [Burkholderiales bacterium]|nr:RnfH family protein [Burkholderiales bacterium]